MMLAANGKATEIVELPTSYLFMTRSEKLTSEVTISVPGIRETESNLVYTIGMAKLGTLKSGAAISESRILASHLTLANLTTTYLLPSIGRHYVCK